MTQQRLGLRLGIDRTTVVSVVDGLDACHLVQRRRDPGDRRAYQLTLTAAGRRVNRRGQLLVDKTERLLLAPLGDSDRRALTDLLARALDGDRPRRQRPNPVE